MKDFDKIEPVPCACGKLPILVKTQAGYKYSCPSVFSGGCESNLMTVWKHNEQQAVSAWNKAVLDYKKEKEGNKNGHCKNA